MRFRVSGGILFRLCGRVFRKGVRRIVHAGQRVEVEMGISLGGGNAAVPEKLLHAAQIRSAFQQMGSVGMAQFVWRNMLGYACQNRAFLHNAHA